MRISMKLWTLLVALMLLAAACGGDDEGEDLTDEGGGDPEATIVHGSSDPPTTYDPAGSYDLPSWNIIYNVSEGLLTIPPGGDTPEPALAESCDFEDDTTYTCALREGVTFHDGSEFDAEDVVFSFQRNIEINDPNGACSLLASLAECGKWTGDEITVDGNSVTFHLQNPDATWPAVLTTGAAAIVPSDTYPGDDLQPSGQVIGTGPYRMAEFRSGEQTVLEAYEDYWGDPPNNGRVIIQLFDASSALKLAVEQGEVDIAYRNLTPTEVDDLRGSDIEVVEGNGTEIRYLVFNLDFEPVEELAVRQAIAQSIDRGAIVENVYNGTVDPLYSMIPVGLPGHIDAFADEYGEEPDPDAAEQTLADAGVSTPVELEIWYTPSRYGDTSADEYAEIQRALEDTGLFRVKLESTEWDQYSTAAFTDQYPAYQLGWFPDFPDADNYIAPFYGSKTSFLNNHFQNRRIDALIEEERTTDDQDERIAAFEEIQEIAAQEVPIIPVWQGKQVAAVQPGISGVEDTFDASFQFRYWLISKEG